MTPTKPKRKKSASLQIIVPNQELWKPYLSPKQSAVVYSTTMFDLVSGPRLTGKSRSVGHSIIKHAWDTERGRVGVFAKSVRNAKVGTWDTTTTTVMEEWMAAKLKSPHGEFGWVKEPGRKPGPRHEGDTRMNYFRIKNWYGGVSEVQLHSLHNDCDVEDVLLDTEFSMIVFLELQKFDTVDIFNVSVPQLRRSGVPSRKYRWLADTNPPESGPDHFAYKLWFIDRVSDVPESITDEAEKLAFRAYQKSFGLHLFDMTDNPKPDPMLVTALRNNYRDDPIGWDRFILGKWTKASSSKQYHFRNIFKPELHVAGDTSGKNPDSWQILVPSHECTLLTTGWDIGASVNHAFVIAEPTVLENEQTAFTFLDELVWIGIEAPLTDFVQEALEKMYAIEKLVGGNVEWRNWSDNSAWQWSAKTTDVDAMLVEKLSLGRVVLMPSTAAKKSSGVSRRIKMVQDLLRQMRLLFSANCTNAVEMMNELRSGLLKMDGKGEVIVRGSPWKHEFDAISYLLWMELFGELMGGNQKTEATESSRLISVEF